MRSLARKPGLVLACCRLLFWRVFHLSSSSCGNVGLSRISASRARAASKFSVSELTKMDPLSCPALKLMLAPTSAMASAKSFELRVLVPSRMSAAVDMILAADKAGLTVEGISFHVGSQTTNFENYVQALNLTASVFKEAKDRGYSKMNLIDIGGGFPAPYDASAKPIKELAKVINTEIDRLFPKDIQILAEPGRFLVVSAGYAVSKVIGKAVRDG